MSRVANSREALHLPDLRHPDQMPSWPEWVASRIGSLKLDHQPHPSTGRWRIVPTLPKALALSYAERDELSRHASDLRAMLERVPTNDQNVQRVVLCKVTEMMLALSSAQMSDLGAEARGGALMTALYDIPGWAVQAAIDRWYRGECGMDAQGKPYSYHWCPAPAELRRIAQRMLIPVKMRLRQLEQLLAAEQRTEFDDEHCRLMRERLQRLLQDLGFSPVGSDGSGERAGETPV